MSASVDVAPSLHSIEAEHDGEISGKRKRSPEPNEDNTLEAKPHHTHISPSGHALQELLADILDILQTRDTNPSILNAPLPTQSSSAPAAKRTKISPTKKQNHSIKEKIKSKTYENIEELSHDISAAIDSLFGSEIEHKQSNHDQFRSLFHALVARQSLHDTKIEPLQSTEAYKDNTQQKEIKLEHGVETLKPSSSTLSFAGPGGRPYFSSLRKTNTTVLGDVKDAQEKSAVEAVLPKGMWTSTVVPLRSREAPASSKQVPTLGQLCPKPSHFNVLEPPRESPLAATRGSAVGWYKAGRFPASRMRVGGRESYSNQKLLTGTWLSNGYIASPIQSASERRRAKDHLSNGGDVNNVQIDAEQRNNQNVKQKQEKDRNSAAFRSVYSSFAPSYDNTNAVIPQDQRRLIWWTKKSTAPNLGVQPNDSMTEEEIAFDLGLVQDAIDNYPEDEQDGPLYPRSKSKADMDTDDILNEVSEMLETLSSYQRNRHSELGAKHTSVDEFGTPSKPSSAEFDLHTILRDQLALLISTLPPFAVSKLNGDQLAELNISTVLQMGETIQRGVLEDESKSSTYQSSGVGSHLRNPSLSARTGSYPGTSAQQSTRNTFSTPRTPSSFYPGRAPSSGPGGYSTYPSHAQSPRPPTQHNTQTHTNSHSAEGGRFNHVTNGYPATNNPATPIPTRTQPYQGTHLQAFQPRPPVNPLHNNYSPSPGQGNSSQLAYQTPPTQQPRLGSATQSQVPNLSQEYSQYQPNASVPRASALSNGADTVGAQFHMTSEERALIASRQRQTEPSTTANIEASQHEPEPKHSSNSSQPQTSLPTQQGPSSNEAENKAVQGNGSTVGLDK